MIVGLVALSLAMAFAICPSSKHVHTMRSLPEHGRRSFVVMKHPPRASRIRARGCGGPIRISFGFGSEVKNLPYLLVSQAEPARA